MINKKAKGTNAERELIHMFWENGWAAFRAAGSGSMKFPCPDIIAGNSLRKIAIECKSTSDERKTLSKKEVLELQEFSQKFGCEAWIGVRFDGKKWFFISIEDLKQNELSYSTNLESLKTRGVNFEELIKDF